MQYGSEGDQPQEGYSLQEQFIQEGPDVLKLVYQIDSVDVITEIEAASARMDNTDGSVICYIILVYENPYRLHVVVTSNAEEDLQRLRALDTIGVLEIECTPANTNSLYDLYEQKH